MDDTGGDSSSHTARIADSTDFREHTAHPLAEQPPRLARGVLYALLGCLGTIGAIQVVVGGPDAWQIGWGLGYTVAVVSVQFLAFGPEARTGNARTYPALAGQAVLVYLPYAQFGEWWVGLPGLLTGSLLLTLPPRVAVPLFGAVVVSIGGIADLYGWVPADVVFHAATTAFTGLTVYALTRLARLIRELQENQVELARMAVAEQRLLFAASLHDLLGTRLSAIMSRGERISRMLPGSPGQARSQLEEVLVIAREGLADVRSVASGYRHWATDQITGYETGVGDAGGDVPEQKRVLPAITRRLAKGVLAAVLCGFGAIAFAGVVNASPGWTLAVVSLVCIVALLGLQIGYFGHSTRTLRSWTTIIALVIQAALVYVPIVEFRNLWLELPGFLAGTVLLMLRPAVAIAIFGSVVASVGLLKYSFSGNLLIATNMALSATTTGLVVYGLTRLARLASELHAARRGFARMAVAQERLRFMRDVHDLLGLTMSAITLKAELASRLIPTYPDRARKEVGEIVELSRRGLGDVRSVVGGDHELSLSEELTSARSVLVAADIEAAIECCDIDFPDPTETTFAAVVREGVTNVLRHSKADHCGIAVWRNGDVALLEIVNDSARDGARKGAEGGGNGIRNLAHRVADVGGELSAVRDADGTYRLRAEVRLR